jgi:hypothetical protein
MTQTMASTMARAKLAMAGGELSGFQAIKTSIDAANRIDPKPPKRYDTVLRNQRDGVE